MKNTRKALKKYDRTKPERQKLWDEAYTTKSIKEAQKADADALKLVQLAFYEDTKHVNPLEKCFLPGIRDLREMAQYKG